MDNYQIRQQMINKRQRLSKTEYQKLSLLCYQHLQKWTVFQEAKRIGIYYSINQEVATIEIIKDLLHQRKTVLLPKIISKNKIKFYEVKDLSMLEIGKYHIPCPNDNCKQSDDMDLLIVPLTGYDLNGNRLGMGGGYYDRYLLEHSVTNCALAFSFQKTSFKVYPHDQKIKYLINENERLTFA